MKVNQMQDGDKRKEEYNQMGITSGRDRGAS
jgi:hypothetical protein